MSEPGSMKTAEGDESAAPTAESGALTGGAEAAPEAKLYINDYDTTDTRKRSFLYRLVRDLRKRGVPVDGVGHQMHSNVETPSAEAIGRAQPSPSSVKTPWVVGAPLHRTAAAPRAPAPVSRLRSVKYRPRTEPYPEHALEGSRGSLPCGSLPGVDIGSSDARRAGRWQ